MLHLLGKGQAPEWDEEKHDIEEVLLSMLSWNSLCKMGMHRCDYGVSFMVYQKPREEG